MPPVGVWNDTSQGISQSGGSLAETLQEWSDEGCKTIVMDAEGEPLGDLIFEGEVGFVLSDHKPFTNDELELLSNLERVSIGHKWLQGHSCIAIAHHHLDMV